MPPKEPEQQVTAATKDKAGEEVKVLRKRESERKSGSTVVARDLVRE